MRNTAEREFRETDNGLVGWGGGERLEWPTVKSERFPGRFPAWATRNVTILVMILLLLKWEGDVFRGKINSRRKTKGQRFWS